MASEFSMVEFDSEEKTPSAKSGVPKVSLTDHLGCEKLRSRVWYLDPDDSLMYHRHGEQEELYVPLERSGQMRIDGELVDVPRGAAVRVPPETPRQLVNESSRQHVWLVVGAPPAEDDGMPVDDE